MKPIYIEIGAFGSYEKPARLDMSQLGESGIYLITGDTGAGKTTIFDAVAYALYGRASGASRGDARVLRCDRAAETDETYAELRFSHNGLEYTVRRNMEYRRKSLRGSGTALVRENAVLRYPDGRAVEGVKRVDAAVLDILGIRYEHFSRIMMIAQGDFARLLMADTQDREPILRAIFDTGIYELFQKELSRRAAELKAATEPIRAAIEARFAGVEYPEGHPAREKIALLIAAPSAYRARELAAALREAAAWDEEALSKLAARRESAASDVERAMSEIADARRLNSDIDQLEKLRNEIAQLEKMTPEMEKTAREADAARRAGDVAQLERAAKAGEKLLSEVRTAIRALEKEQARLVDEEKNCEARCRESEKARENAEEARDRAVSIEGMMARYDRLEEIKEKLAAADDEQARALSAAEDARRKAGEMENRALEIDARRQELDGARAELARREGEMKNLALRAEGLRILLGKLDVMDADRKIHAARRAAAAAALVEEKRISDDYYALRGAFFAAQAGYMAAELAPGAPWPVCGSREHPRLAALEKDAPDQSALDRSEKRLSAAREKSTALQSEAAALRQQLLARFDELKAEFARAAGEDAGAQPLLDDMRTRTRTLLAAAEDGIVRAGNELSSLQARAREDAALSAQRADINARLPGLVQARADAEARREAAQASHKALTAQEAQLREGLEFPGRAQAEKAAAQSRRAYEEWAAADKKVSEALNACRQARASAADRMSMLASQEKSRERELMQSRREFLDGLNAADFGGEEEYRAALRPAETIRDMLSAVENHARRLDFSRRTAEGLEKNVAGRPRADEEGLLEKRRAAQSALDALTMADGETRRRMEDAIKRARALEADAGKLDDAGRRCEMALSLANTAAGREHHGAGKITFERYILIDYFDRVLRRANIRFSRMAGGHYELVRARETSDLRAQTGLELNVLDHFTGRERSVRSLSGGESFMASLSLALGFADVIRMSAGGVSVEAMFVDEGFGSLDPEALDQVVNVLTSLAGDKKLIGIISHVADLKSRVSRRIVVEKTREGSRARIET